MPKRLDALDQSDAPTAPYESPSQFSREYVRTFGAPPKRDAKHMQTTLREDRAAADAELIAENA